MFLLPYVNFLTQSGAQLNTQIFCYKKLVIVNWEQQQHFFGKLEVKMLFVQTAEAAYRDRAALIAQELLQLCTNQNQDRNYNPLFARESERPWPSQSFKQLRFGLGVNNGIGMETLTEITKRLIVFPLQRQKSRDIRKNTLDVEASPEIPVPRVPQT